MLNGSDGTSQVIGDFTGTTTPTYTSTHSDGCLTFIFQSNSTSTSAGWEAIASCVVPSAGDDANHLTSTCGEQNCLGGCLRTLCGIPSNVAFQGDGYANQELNESTNGCWTAPERCSNWFYINPLSAGDLSLNLFVNSGQDQDFLIWEAFGDELQCPAETSAAPISCNYQGATAQGTGFNDDLTGTNPAYEPSLYITEDDIANGIYYMVNIQTYSNGAACPQPNVDVTFGGSVDLGCGAPIPLGVNLTNFTGVAKERTNELHWSTASETDNDYFTVQSSLDYNTWSDVAVVDGAGTTTERSDYELNDDQYSSRITYYRIMETDFNGVNTYSYSIALARDIEINTIISNIFPNPSNDEMHFVARGGNSDMPITMNVYNSVGQKVISKEYTDYSGSVALSFNVSELPVGIYNVEVINGDMLEMQKISIVR